MKLRVLGSWLLVAACSRSHPAAPAPAPATVAPPAPDVSVPTADVPEPPPPPRPSPPVASVTLGATHGCALLRDHTVRCWGANTTGQLGDGTTTDRRLPLPVTDLEHVVNVSAGSGHTCAVLEDGAARCWGDNRSGQLGEGTTGEHDLTHAVSNLDDAVEIAAGAAHTCARKRGGTVVCWGDNTHGELGDGTHTQQTAPVVVRGVTGVAQIVAGDGFSCARLGDGAVRCWGGANPLRSFGETARSPLGAVRGAVSLAANGTGVCAALSGGAVRCWDVLANAPSNPPDTRALHGLEVAVSVGAVPRFANGLPAAPDFHAIVCARAAAGTVACGGDGERGQLGDGQSHVAPSAAVRDLRDIVQIAAGGESVAAGGHSCGVVCALDRAGLVRCWGCNEHGLVGDGTMNDRTAPTAISW